jgi:hypothetical protein
LAGNDVLELDAIVLLPHLAEPVSNISAQNERVISYFAAPVPLVGDKGGEGDGDEVHLFISHLTELTASLNFLKYELCVALSHSKKLVSLMKFLILRFIRTLKENLLWVRTFDTIEELRAALVELAPLAESFAAN